MTWIAVGVGGALGSMGRHWVNTLISHWFEQPVPWATFAVNLVGCLVIGALAGQIATGRLTLSPVMRTFVFVGILGGFTTFSSFEYETYQAVRGGARAIGLCYVAGSVLAGYLAVWAGAVLAARR